MRALLAALALGLATPLGAQDRPVWRTVDATTSEIKDVSGLEQLARDFPDSVTVRLRLLNAYLVAGDGLAAIKELAWLEVRGHVFSDSSKAQISVSVGADHAQEARGLLLSAPEPIAASTVVAIVPAEAGLVESVISPVPGKVFLVTSISEQTVFVRMPGSEWRRADVPGTAGLSGIVDDPGRNLHWIAAGDFDGGHNSETRFSGLIRMSSGSYDHFLFPAPDGVTLSDLVLGPDGAVYASDPLGGGVYHVAAKSDRIATLLKPGALRSPQGLAVSADGARLYVSDYRYGLAVIDLADGTVSRLASDVPVALDGVDGMWLHEDELIAVQNGTMPMRISAFRLSPDGLRITGHRVLEQAHPDWTEPLGGSIAGGALYYIGNGQWDRFDGSQPRPDTPALPTQIRRLRL